jgi:hypothetical protein
MAIWAQNRYVFILGHMRSGSSLLCHLLCTSDDILGYGETHNNYRRRSDLAKLLMALRKQTGLSPLRCRYALDKIVSSQHVICRAILNDSRSRFIFLVREPIASVASLVAMRRQFKAESDQQLISFATQHYTERLEQLTQFAEAIDDRGRSLLVTHEQLLTRTPETFRTLESFLDLSEPLREDYKILPTTGQPGVGDPSANIRLGRISRSLPRKHIELSPALRARLICCYEHSFNGLSQRSQNVGDLPILLASQAA